MTFQARDVQSSVRPATGAAVTHDSAASEAQPARAGRTALPTVDIYEDEEGITLLADLPGVSKEGLNVQLEGDVLSIEGSIGLNLPESLTPLYNEMGADRFARSFTLSRELDAGRIAAEINDGLLRLTIPKAEALRPRKVEVRING